ncbi:MAG TPA: aminotransferase class I/II-fold pyridoxal phosphate-dependent enzyme [Phycisphaerales bacterium]|nr:aminotransferase class I/II-fold pyridoxal phosphate-dependent enzyme [Phycisphaerales bacterium]
MSAALSAVSRSIPVRSDRLAALPPFLFDEIDRKKRERIAAGADVINLGVGDPDQPTPGFIVEAMNKAMRELVNQQYPAVGGGLKVFRESAARFMSERFGVKVDPMRHIVCCIGSKDGIAHLPWAVTNPGDTILVPDPAYPVYEIGAVLAHCKVEKMPVSADTEWRPTFSDIPPGAAANARILWLNYPSNPTAACADVPFFERAVEWTNSTWEPGSRGKQRGCILASDLAYSELFFEHRPVSAWQAPNADIESTPAIEFHSLSKTFNMTGWRIGFAVGHADIIATLAGIKANVDSGLFNAIQVAGAAALDGYQHPDVDRMRNLYRERRDTIVPGLRAAGCEVHTPEAGFFVWARTPKGTDGRHLDSMTFAGKLLAEADTVVVPGAGFSPRAREWFRVALTVESPRLAQAAARIAKLTW